MAREIISTVTTKLYDNQGRHVADMVDEYFVNKRSGAGAQAQPTKPTPRPTTPPPSIAAVRVPGPCG